MIISKSINSDLLIKDPAQEVYAVQGDCYTREVILRLHANKIPWTPTKPVSVAIRYRKPDGTGGTYDTLPNGEKAWKLEGNSVSFLLAPQMLTAPGRVAVQVELLCNDSILASFPLYVVVTEDTSAGVVPSKDYFNWQQRLEDKLTERLAEAKNSGEFDGATGATPKLRIGTVTTLENDSSAFAEIRGSAEYPILDLYLPKGADAVTDATLTQANSAADAKVTGDMLAGKAPAGHGLGEPSARLFDWSLVNQIKQNGWYCCSTGGTNIDSCYFSYARMFVQNWNEDNLEQTLYPVLDANLCLRRICLDSVWLPWEWMNPPMYPGVEYRTTERYMGKAIYTCLVNTGVLANGMTAIKHNLSMMQPLSCQAAIENEQSIPARYYDAQYDQTLSVYVTYANIFIHSSGIEGDALGKDVYCILKYTKD